MMRGLLYAIGFLTRIPVPVSVFEDTRARRLSVLAYPLVGLLLGVILAGLGLLLEDHDDLLASALILVVWVGLTGGLHLDGLADSADAWIGGLGERTRTLDIMKDPRCGPSAVVAVVLLLLTKLAALQAMPGPLRMPALLLAPLLGRTALTALLASTPYARAAGLASDLDGSGRAPWLVMAAALLASLLAGVDGLLASVAAATVFGVWRQAGMRRLGGYTGDTAGAMAEMVELAVLVVMALRLG